MADEEVSVKVKITGISDALGDLRSASKAVDTFVSGVNKANFSGFVSSLSGITSNLGGFDKLNQAASNTGKAFSTAAPQVSTFSDKVSTLGGGGVISGVIGGLGNLASSVGGVAGKLGDLGAAAGGAIISGIEHIGSAAAGAAGKLIDLGIHAAEAAGKFAIGFGKDSIAAAKDFDAAISEVAAVSGASADDIQNMTDKALELGAKFPVSAKDAAQAMGELAKAGFTAQQAIDASAGVVQLASATHYNMADSATIVANAMNGFGLTTNDATKNLENSMRVTDLLAKGANASAVSVKDLSKTFEYAAPVAKAAGFSIEDVTKAAGLMGNAGIKASSAGTGLKTIISELASPSKSAAGAFDKLGFSTRDAAGNIKPMQTQLSELRDKFSTLSSAEKIDLAKQIVGKDHFAKLLAIVDSSKESFDQMSDAVDHAKGAGKDMADVMNDNLAGAVDNMKGSLETLQIKFGKAFQPFLQAGANIASGLINAFNPVADDIAKALAPVGKTAKEFSKNFADSAEDLPKAFGQAVNGILGKTDDLGKLSGVINNLFGAGTGDKVVSTIQKIGDTFGPLISKVFELNQAFSPLSNAFSIFEGFLTGGLQGGLSAFEKSILKVGDALGIDLTGAVSTLDNFIQNNLLPALGGIGNFITTTALPALQSFGGFITSTVLPAVGNIGSTILTNVLPALGNFGNFITGTVLPAVQSFATWIGTNVGPILTSMGNTFNTVVLPALNNFGTFIGTTVVPKLQELGNWIGVTIVPLLEKFAGFIASTVVPVLGSVASFVMGTVIPALTEWWSLIATALAPVIERVASFIGSTLLPALSDIGSFITGNVIPALSQMWSFVQANILPILKEVATFIGGQLASTFDGFATTATTTWNVVSTVVSTAWNVVSGIWNTLSSTLGGPLSSAFETFEGIVSGVWDAVSDFISSAGSTISGIFKDISSDLKPLSSAFESAEQTVETVWTGITTAISSAWSSISGTFDQITGFLSGPLSSAWDAASSTVSSTWSAITSTIGSAVSNIISTVGKVPGEIADALRAGVGAMVDAGSALIGGLARGITSIHIPLPHINVSFHDTSVGPLTVPVPDFSVKWFAKGGIVDGAQIIGVGERGPEAVMPLNKLVPLMSDALLSATKSMSASPSQIYNNAATSSTTIYNNRNYNMGGITTQQPVSNIQQQFSMMEAWSI